MANNYLNYIQILTDNYLLESGASLRLPPSSSSLSSKPISYKFGGDQEVGTGIVWNSISLRAVNPDSSFYNNQGFAIDLDLGADQRSTNCLLQFEGSGSIDPDSDWLAIIECRRNTVFPSTNFNSQSGYTPDDIYFGRRSSKDFFYFNLPRNISYRYYRIKIYDPNNISGSILLKDIFLGDSVDIDRAPAQGISHESVDLSRIFTAESGREYCLEKPIYQSISNLDLPFLKRYQVSALKIWSDQMGISSPFWMILDPQGIWDGPVFGMSFGVYRLQKMPTFSHQFADIWSSNLSLKEVI